MSDVSNTFARCRRLALEAARAARLGAFTARNSTPRPGQRAVPYKPDLAALDPAVARSLQAAIDAIERHDAACTLDASTRRLRSAVHSATTHAPATRGTVRV